MQNKCTVLTQFVVITGIWFLSFSAFAQEDLNYQRPPQSISNLVDAPLTPFVSVSPSLDKMLLAERPGYPSIEEVAQPELRLAGLRINPRTNGSSRSYYQTGLQIQSMNSPMTQKIQGLPTNPQIENISWSPDGQKMAFTISLSDGIELWMADVNTLQASKLTDAVVNDALRGLPYTWLSDNQHILCKTVLPNRGEAPQALAAPKGPTIQETKGKKAAVRTYQDLLKNAQDEALFNYYASSQLVMIDVESKSMEKFGSAGVITSFSVAPNAEYILVTSLQKPYSYLVPYSRFPSKVEVWNRQGSPVKTIAEIPLADDIPKGFGATRKGPRSFQWRADKPASLYWVEAQDGGDPYQEAEVRDKLFYLDAPFAGEKVASIDFKLRYGGITWGDDNMAISYEWWWTNRQEITSQFSPTKGNDAKKTLFDVSFEDRYNAPGNFVTHSNAQGRQVLLSTNKGRTLYLTGRGASSEGDRPFVDEFTINTQKKERIWRSEAPYYEVPIEVIDPSKRIFVTRRESKTEPPNYFVRDLKKNKITTLTQFPHPYESLKDVEKQLITYKRADGVDLKGELYLPKDFKKGDDPLPVLMWAYPNEFKSKKAASQVSGSPYTFIRMSWATPIYWVNRGYAVFDKASMPVIGEGDKEPNDTFVEQLVANAQAAIDKLADMGVADRERVAVGGHSYGAFMTANLLAHSDLFAAGIARSGAYNRTLTPFGFQREERTYWEAPEIYYAMSPFMHADKINEPLLMVHGEADNNSGTFPLQSKRYYAAIKGLGGTARLVMLPHESHGYRAKESILHMLWEMDQWLEKHVKNKSDKEDEGSR